MRPLLKKGEELGGKVSEQNVKHSYNGVFIFINEWKFYATTFFFFKDESWGCYAHHAECTKPVRVNYCLIHSRVKFTETGYGLGPTKGWEAEETDVFEGEHCKVCWVSWYRISQTNGAWSILQGSGLTQTQALVCFACSEVASHCIVLAAPKLKHEPSWSQTQKSTCLSLCLPLPPDCWN